MKRNKVLGIIFSSIFSLCVVPAASVILSKGEINHTIEVVAATDDYYASISDDIYGNTLRQELNKLNNTKRKKTVGYAGMRQFAAVCDADPDGSGKIIGFYDNEKVGPAWDSGNTWNREHVWPNVRGGSAVEDDAHMTRPASTKTNSDRGSKGYGATSYDPGQFVPYYRGAASRIIFYAAIASLNLNLVDDPLNYHGGNPADSMGSLSEMLKWNLEYLPSDTSFTGANDLARRTELSRNEKIQNASGGQGNRNPFIDHPEYACKIWGDTNDKTRAICAGHYQPDEGGGSSGGDTTPKEDTPVSTPSTSKTYKLGVYQAGLSQQYYINGEISNVKYGDTVTEKENAADVNLIVDGEGYNLKVTKKSGGVVYLNGILDSSNKPGISFDSSSSTVWTFDTTSKSLQTTLGSTKYFLNAYNSFSTLSLSNVSYLGSSTTYTAHLYDIDSQTPGGDDQGGGDSSDVTPIEPSDSGNNEKPKGGGGCHASIEGNSSILFIGSSALLFFAIRQAIKARKKEEK